MFYKGYYIVPSKGGGKAGKGRNKTASVQVLKPVGNGNQMMKQVRYTVGDSDSQNKAIRKAIAKVDELTVGDND